MVRFLAVGLICIFLQQVLAVAEMPATAVTQMTTEEHLAKPGWWPRKGDASRSDYVGAAICAECHSALVSSQQQHAMAHSSSRVTNTADVTQAVHFANGPAQYSIITEGKILVYKVQFSGQSFSAPLEWIFGSGRHGQTSLYRRNGELWETHITTFKDFGPDITPGESTALPTS